MYKYRKHASLYESEAFLKKNRYFVALPFKWRWNGETSWNIDCTELSFNSGLVLKREE